MSGIVYVDWIVRATLRGAPEARFVFGDNTIRQGYGGQAREMRDEPNAIGIATKWFPGSSSGDFFSDDDLRAFEIVNDDIDLVVAALAEGRTVYAPKAGLGTGLSELPTRAPALHAHIVNRFRALSGPDFPWGSN